LRVRLFAQEAEMLLMVGLFMTIASLLLITSMGDTGLLDRLIPVTVLASVFMGRVLQTRAEAVRLLTRLHRRFGDARASANR
jgi:hypothetical protein